MLYAKLIGHIALFTCGNIAHIEFYLQGLLPKILAIYTIKETTVCKKLLSSITLQCFLPHSKHLKECDIYFSEQQILLSSLCLLG